MIKLSESDFLLWLKTPGVINRRPKDSWDTKIRGPDQFHVSPSVACKYNFVSNSKCFFFSKMYSYLYTIDSRRWQKQKHDENSNKVYWFPPQNRRPRTKLKSQQPNKMSKQYKYLTDLRKNLVFWMTEVGCCIRRPNSGTRKSCYENWYYKRV